MTRGPFPHALTPLRPPQVGLVVLQSDETVEIDLRRLLAPDVELLVTRVPSGAEVLSRLPSVRTAYPASWSHQAPSGRKYNLVGF